MKIKTQKIATFTDVFVNTCVQYQIEVDIRYEDGGLVMKLQSGGAYVVRSYSFNQILQSTLTPFGFAEFSASEAMRELKGLVSYVS